MRVTTPTGGSPSSSHAIEPLSIYIYRRFGNARRLINPSGRFDGTILILRCPPSGRRAAHVYRVWFTAVVARLTTALQKFFLVRVTSHYDVKYIHVDSSAGLKRPLVVRLMTLQWSPRHAAPMLLPGGTSLTIRPQNRRAPCRLR